MSEEEYFQIIEGHFLQKRGNPMLLSPKEWTLIREWYEAKIPQEVVLRAIDRAFEKNGDDEKEITSLLYCKRIVKSEYKRLLKSLEGKNTAGSAAPETKNIVEFIDRLIALLQESQTQAAQEPNSALAGLLERSRQRLMNEVLKSLQQNSSTDLQRVEQQLTTIEKEIEQMILQTISEERMTVLKEEAMRDLKMFQEKIDLPVYQEMLRRNLIKSIRKLYNVPRLSLFYM